MDRRTAIRARQWAMALRAGEDWQRRLPEIRKAWDDIRQRGPIGADTPQRVAKFVARETLRSATGILDPADPRFLGIERRFGPTLDYDYTPPRALAQAVGKSIARLVETDGNAGAVSGFATGFMVSTRLLMTNWHVYPDASEAKGTSAQFAYEYRGATLQDGVIFALRPDDFFYSTEALDLALVAVDAINEDGAARKAFSFIRLIPSEGKILKGQPVNMIGYPDGLPKTYVFKNNPLIDVGQDTLAYLTDSDGGSSGSGDFNNMWELIGLHHRGVPRMVNGEVQLKGGGTWHEGMSSEDIDWVANEGIRVSSIVKHVRDLGAKAPSPFIDELLSTAVDPVGEESRDMTGARMIMPIDPAASAGAVQMSFSGPVTINIAAGAALIPAAVPAPIPASDSGSPAPGAEANIRFDPDYDSRPGYKPDFLAGFTVPHPKASAGRAGEMLTDGGAELVLKYHHYSLAMNKIRRLQMWSAVNVDYEETARQWFKKRTSFGTDHWIPDPRIPAKYQILGPEAYDPSKSLQRGHIVRREDSAWGTDKANQEFSNSDTFHWTNCTPQHGGFNESSYAVGDGTSYKGLWGALENQIQALAQQSDEMKLIVLGGPVLNNDKDKAYDWGYGPIQIPMKFWKVVLAVEADALSSYGFLLDQTQAFRDLGFERLNFGQFEKYQVPIADIAALAGVDFDDIVLSKDVLAGKSSVKLNDGGPITKKN